ncbi:hypothetical protein ACTHPF_12250 [Paenibacillus sp. SAF-054]|uniref:hypothetical protein n=1 Tax=unclassified Paenibacillus TaxID=185978 RepID=UPI003F7D6298
MSKADNMLAIFVDAETREERSSPALERKKAPVCRKRKSLAPSLRDREQTDIIKDKLWHGIDIEGGSRDWNKI